MSLRSIPAGAQEDVYQLALLALNDNDLIEGLVEHYRQTSTPIGLECEPVDAYRQVLGELSHECLADLFFETAIGNDRYHPDARQFYIDPKCTKAYSVDALQAHFYRSALNTYLLALNFSVSDPALEAHMTTMANAILNDKHKVDVALGELVVTASMTKFKVNVSHPYLDLLQPRQETEALNLAFRQWSSRMKGIDLTYSQDEALTP